MAPKKRRVDPTMPGPSNVDSDSSDAPESPEREEREHDGSTAKAQPLFGTKFTKILCEPMVKMPEFRGFNLVPAFQRLGWESILFMTVTGYFGRLVCQWLDGAKWVDKKKKDALVGKYGGQRIEITVEDVRQQAGIDTLREDPTDPNSYQINYIVMGSKDDQYRKGEGVLEILLPSDHGPSRDDQRKKCHMLPYVQFLLRFITSLVHPRGDSDTNSITISDQATLCALITETPRYSLGHIILHGWMKAKGRRNQSRLPHAYILTQILLRKGAVSRTNEKLVPQNIHTVDHRQFPGLQFEVTDTEAIIRVIGARNHYEGIEYRLPHGHGGDVEVPIVVDVSPPPQFGPAMDEDFGVGDVQLGVELSGFQQQPRPAPQPHHFPPRQPREAVSTERLMERMDLRFDQVTWDIHRAQYQTEVDLERHRRHYDHSHGYPPITREDYFARRQPEGDTTPWEDRYPATEQWSLYPPAADSPYYTGQPQMDHVPPQFQSSYQSIFGSHQWYPPPRPPPQ